MKNKALILIKIRYLFYILLCIILLSTCRSETITKQTNQFEISKYKGYKVVYKCDYGNWGDRDWYVLRTDTVAIELRVPKWFSVIYNIGDTIK